MTYAVFAGEYYYPRGGWDDFKGVFCHHERVHGMVIETG